MLEWPAQMSRTEKCYIIIYMYIYIYIYILYITNICIYNTNTIYTVLERLYKIYNIQYIYIYYNCFMHRYKKNACAALFVWIMTFSKIRMLCTYKYTNIVKQARRTNHAFFVRLVRRSFSFAGHDYTS